MVSFTAGGYKGWLVLNVMIWKGIEKSSYPGLGSVIIVFKLIKLTSREFDWLAQDYKADLVAEEEAEPEYSAFRTMLSHQEMLSLCWSSVLEDR